MAITKRLKNASGSSKFILTRNVADNTYYDVPVYLWDQLLSDDDLVADIASGDIVVNDGSSDLGAAAGQLHIEKFQSLDSITFTDITDYQYAESESESSTSSTNYQQKLRLTTSSLSAGDYRIAWHFEYAVGSNNKKAQYQVQVDDSTTIHSIDPEIRANYWQNSAGIKRLTLTSGTHTIDIDYRKSNATAKIRKARIDIWRVA